MLKPGGRLALLTIETAPDLSQRDQTQAAGLGPSAVGADAPAHELVRRAGLQVRHVQDLTRDFSATCTAIWQERRSAERELRAVEGDEAYDVEQSKKEHMLEGIRLGLLGRSLVVAERV